MAFASVSAGADAPAPAAAARDPNEPDDLGQGRPQRGLPLRLRQEVQALPRAVRVSRPPGRSRSYLKSLPVREGFFFGLLVPRIHAAKHCAGRR